MEEQRLKVVLEKEFLQLKIEKLKYSLLNLDESEDWKLVAL